jgi:hypothetical protein
MSRMAMFVCDVCARRSSDHDGWFVVSGDGAHLDVATWDEEAAVDTGARHACSAAHVEKLVFSTLSPELQGPLVALPVRRGGWNPAALEPAASDEPMNAEEALMSVLDAIDVALQAPTRDEEEALAFDA